MRITPQTLSQKVLLFRCRPGMEQNHFSEMVCTTCALMTSKPEGEKTNNGQDLFMISTPQNNVQNFDKAT